MIRIDGRDWTLDDITTLNHCDAAEEYLADAIVKIELQLEDTSRVAADPDWEFNARVALRKKRLAQQLVARRRGEINRQTKDWNTRFINRVRDTYPIIYNDVSSRIGA